MPGEAELRRLLQRIDGRGYKAYKDLRGAWSLDGCELHVDHVQADPFAAPSKLRLRVAMDEARIPPELQASRVQRVALADFLARRVRTAIRQGESAANAARAGGPRPSRRGSGRSGEVSIDAGGQEVLERTAIQLGEGFVEARLFVGLPAAGRRALGREAEGLLCADLPRLAARALRFESLPPGAAERFVACVENQEHLRGRLDEHALVAFVAEGSLLPRESGASDRPLREGAVPFAGPESLRVELELPHPTRPEDPGSRRIGGLGVPRGVTLVVGGGYHGKSTLLRALERGVHPHVPGDGREGVVTDPTAVKIRAEDGRRVERCDISGFIGELPGGRSTSRFSSDDASGSTSQAANIVEALEVGAGVLLLDEDTSATNFMVRDARMQALVPAEHEPITPFVDRVGELYAAQGISTVIVMGGCGDYFDVADTVIEMREFRARDVTAEARAVAETHATRRSVGSLRALAAPTPRAPRAASVDPARGRHEAKIDALGVDRLRFGKHEIDLRGVEQLLDPSQTRAVGQALRLARERLLDGARSLREVVEALDRIMDAEGLDALDPFRGAGTHPGALARPRRFEIAAALNRLRSLGMEPRGPS